MRQTLGKGVVAAAAATSMLWLCGGAALADSTASGATKESPGVSSGSTAEVPVGVPVNACGDTVDGAAGLNAAFGDTCVEEDDSSRHLGGLHRGGSPEDTPADDAGAGDRAEPGTDVSTGHPQETVPDGGTGMSHTQGDAAPDSGTGPSPTRGDDASGDPAGTPAAGDVTGGYGDDHGDDRAPGHGDGTDVGYGTGYGDDGAPGHGDGTDVGYGTGYGDDGA
ncbi:chaplin, partial [Streptomyces cinereospinus]